MHQRIKSTAFTLVELLIIIVVIGILATIVAVAYNGWRERTAVTEVRLDSDGIQAGMQDARNRTNAFPVFPIGTQFDGSSNGTKTIYTQNKNVTITYARGNVTSYCVDIVSTVAPSVRLFLDTAGGNQTPKQGTCDGGESVIFNASDTIFVFDTSAPGCTGTVQLPVSSPTSGGTIDWGDGSAAQSLSTSLQSHAYSTPKTYVVKYSGPIAQASYYSSVNATNAKCLTKVLQWGNSVNVTRLSFYRASNLSYVADPPQTVTDMSYMFSSATAFNQPIGSWNTAAVTNMAGMFLSATAFNQPIGSWNTGNVTNMSNLFSSSSAFNQPIGDWDTSKVTNMFGMFSSATAFNQPIGSWNTAAVTNMAGMFHNSSMIPSSFNQPIGSWNTTKVTDMSNMFRGAQAFNQPIGSWNTAAVTNMSGMFLSAFAFNQPVGSWDTSNVTNMSSMFASDVSFNQPIGSWNTAKVTNMSGMFNFAGSFNQNISGWNVGLVTAWVDFRTSSPLTNVNTPSKFL